jgi:hypothetical protein
MNIEMARILFFIGIWVAVLPYLGFPYFIKNLLFIFTGFFIIYLSLLIYRRLKPKKKEIPENFFENSSFSENSSENKLDQV